MKTEATIVMLTDKQRARIKAWQEQEAQKWLALSAQARAERNAFQYGTDEPPDWWKEASTWIFGVWEDTRNARIDLPNGLRRFAIKGDFVWLDEQGYCQCSEHPPEGYVPQALSRPCARLPKHQRETLQRLVADSPYPVRVTVNKPRRGKLWYVEAHAHTEKIMLGKKESREVAQALAKTATTFIRELEEQQ